jgi:integrase
MEKGKRRRRSVKPVHGSVFMRHGAWHWKYYTGERKTVDLGESGKWQEVRYKQVSVKLADVSDTCRTKQDAIALANERAAQLVTVNTDQPRTNNMTIVDFAESVYLPRIQARKHPSTYNGYLKLWTKHIRPHCEARKLFEYRTSHATDFFEKLADAGLGRYSIAHVRSFMSGLFKHAVSRDYIASNPIRDAETPQTKKPETKHYTREEMVKVLNALRDKPQGFIAMLLCFVGLRPAEMRGLKWEDIDPIGVLHLRRSAWRGHISEGDSGKKRHVRDIPVGVEVVRLLERYKETLPLIVSGHVLENSAGKPMSLEALAYRVIIPAHKVAGVSWKTYYGGRRGAETEMGRFTNGNTQLTAPFFGHTKRVADEHYQKALPDATEAAAVSMYGSLVTELKSTKFALQGTVRDSGKTAGS